MNRRMTPSQIQSLVLYRDGLILVLDKPAGLPVHAGPAGGDNLERHFGHLRYGLPLPPALAHRLDRDTSGCLVLGRHRKALSRLGRLFREGKVEKTYWAMVAGRPASPEGVIDCPLSKVSTKAGGWRVVADPAGRPAITRFRVMGEGSGLSWLELAPETGRTHQVRVHCAHLGCPILGDRQYGWGPAERVDGEEAPLHLHARSVRLPLYPGKAPIEVRAEPPRHMLVALKACGWHQ
jgi:tRNA pseudouridine32 synthase/23S rRNA pseudouridine746 synthase/23S rRNA pseudouridine1911/1915/1917 synthase